MFLFTRIHYKDKKVFFFFFWNSPKITLHIHAWPYWFNVKFQLHKNANQTYYTMLLYPVFWESHRGAVCTCVRAPAFHLGPPINRRKCPVKLYQWALSAVSESVDVDETRGGGQTILCFSSKEPYTLTGLHRLLFTAT